MCATSKKGTHGSSENAVRGCSNDPPCALTEQYIYPTDALHPPRPIHQQCISEFTTLSSISKKANQFIIGHRERCYHRGRLGKQANLLVLYVHVHSCFLTLSSSFPLTFLFPLSFYCLFVFTYACPWSFLS